MAIGRLQLALPFPQPAGYEAMDFIAARSNEAALSWLARGDWPERRLAIWGQDGCGKTHLVHAWARRHDAVLLAGPMLHDLALVPEAGALALDDANAVAEDHALLHLLNTARDRGLWVLLSARLPPARWPVRLPDLSSRLRAMAAVEIHQPEDGLLHALLVRLLAERQLEVAPAVQAWLLRRLPRSPAALRQAVACLDREGLAFGKAITRPLAAHALMAKGLLAGDEGISLAPSCQIRGLL